MLSLTRSVDERHIKKDFLYFWNYLWKCSVNAKCRIKQLSGKYKKIDGEPEGESLL